MRHGGLVRYVLVIVILLCPFSGAKPNPPQPPRSNPNPPPQSTPNRSRLPIANGVSKPPKEPILCRHDTSCGCPDSNRYYEGVLNYETESESGHFMAVPPPPPDRLPLPPPPLPNRATQNPRQEIAHPRVVIRPETQRGGVYLGYQSEGDSARWVSHAPPPPPSATSTSSPESDPEWVPQPPPRPPFMTDAPRMDLPPTVPRPRRTPSSGGPTSQVHPQSNGRPAGRSASQKDGKPAGQKAAGFKTGQEFVKDEEHGNRPSTATDICHVEEMRAKVLENGRFELVEQSNISEGSVHTILIENVDTHRVSGFDLQLRTLRSEEAQEPFHLQVEILEEQIPVLVVRDAPDIETVFDDDSQHQPGPSGLSGLRLPTGPTFSASTKPPTTASTQSPSTSTTPSSASTNGGPQVQRHDSLRLSDHYEGFYLNELSDSESARWKILRPPPPPVTSSDSETESSDENWIPEPPPRPPGYVEPPATIMRTRRPSQPDKSGSQVFGRSSSQVISNGNGGLSSQVAMNGNGRTSSQATLVPSNSNRRRMRSTSGGYRN
ncbi:unnamed protein product [Bemisia tabaci]|uniref:Uncharacterized protein n=1 Tax=Bemisia tabaci TaxID=7038 RepID=A0A9P0AP51_BEMTA|nr:unnamed protein product [Bemisia tabaci]